MNPVDPADPLADAAPVPARHSLRAKAALATVVLLVYLLASVAYVAVERARVYASVQSLQQLSRHEKALALTEAAVSGAVVDVSVTSNAATPVAAPPADISLYIETCAKLFAALDEFDTVYAPMQREIARSHAELLEAPVRASWIGLRESLAHASEALDARRRVLAEQRERLMDDYQRRYDAVTTEALLLSLFGILAFGAVAAWFFTRLAGDIRALEAHARRIVRGSRGTPLPVTRVDELGRLMHAVNRMSDDLDQREKQIELDGERRSHHDKMRAVGALAAGVAHEVNNPLAVIAGTAQELCALDADLSAPRVAEAAQLILAQTQRASHAARHLAELAAPPPVDFDWVDVNSLLTRVAQLMAYDRRYRAIQFVTTLDPELPALQAPGATVQQALMQMLSLGCEAMAAQRCAGPVTLRSCRTDAAVEVQLAFPVALDFTQPEVQRQLLLSRAMVEPLRGRLAFDQDPMPMLRIKLAWPTNAVGG